MSMADMIARISRAPREEPIVERRGLSIASPATITDYSSSRLGKDDRPVRLSTSSRPQIGRTISVGLHADHNTTSDYGLSAIRTVERAWEKSSFALESRSNVAAKEYGHKTYLTTPAIDPADSHALANADHAWHGPAAISTLGVSDDSDEDQPDIATAIEMRKTPRIIHTVRELDVIVTRQYSVSKETISQPASSDDLAEMRFRNPGNFEPKDDNSGANSARTSQGDEAWKKFRPQFGNTTNVWSGSYDGGMI